MNTRITHKNGQKQSLQGGDNMKNNETDKIKKMYERVNTPEYDVKEAVLKELGRQQSVPRLNKKVLIAAIVCLILLMVGTAGATGIFDHMLVFRRPNENYQLGMNEPLPTPVPAPEDIVIDEQDVVFIMSQFINQIQPGEFRCAFSFDEANGTGTGAHEVSLIKSDDFEEIIKYLQNSNTPLPIPKYIPKGYEFVKGQIYLYLDESILDSEPYKAWEEDGINYYIFQLSEGYQRNIEVYSLEFTDKNGNDVDIRMHLSPMMQGGHGFGASETAVAEYIDIKGFDESLLIYDKEKQYSYMYNLALYKDIDAIYSVNFSSKLHDEFMNFDNTNYDYTESLQNIMIRITADEISKKEILKIGEHMK